MNVAWVDFCRAYDSIPFRSILKMLELIGVATNAKYEYHGNMDNGSVHLRERTRKLNIRRGILGGDSLSPLLFVITLIPFTVVLRTLKPGCLFGKGKEKLSYFLFMDDVKL